MYLKEQTLHVVFCAPLSAPLSQLAVSLEVQKSSLGAQDDTEQDGVEGVDAQDGTEQDGAKGVATQVDTEQDGVEALLFRMIQIGTTERIRQMLKKPRVRVTTLLIIEVILSDDFMEGRRRERLFGPTDADDVNVVASGDVSDLDSDADDEDVMEDNGAVHDVKGVDDVEDMPLNDDISNESLFDLTSVDLRDISENGWVTYDEEHSGKPYDKELLETLELVPLPTTIVGLRSAVVYADPPPPTWDVLLLLPKELWARIAEETNRSEVFGGRVPLCRHVRRADSGNTLTCSQIWHDTWDDGKSIPPSLKKKIRFRKGKRGSDEEEE
ncbi:hypothetical protein DVH05_028015 [Phytophthora capsici]|nr:hypothetical protein DVH05_028015 [Phytophthora capsici]